MKNGSRATLQREKRAYTAEPTHRPRRPQALPSVTPPLPSPPADPAVPFRGALGLLLLAFGLWSYSTTLLELSVVWWRVEDYVYGFLVIPFAVLFLVVRSDSYPGLASSAPVLSLILLAISLGLRHAGDAFFFSFMDGWSIVPWTAAVVALIGGWPLLRWSWPSIVFLIFMVPLPFSIEYDLSAPLQRIATVLSTGTLQVLGQPAFAEGNVILLGDERLEVAQACSGLRMFGHSLVLAFAFAAIIRRPWWEKLVLILAAAPVAILVNVARIVATGLLYRITARAEIRQWMHDGAGWGMVLLAGLLLALLLWYLQRLFKEEAEMDMSAVVRQCHV